MVGIIVTESSPGLFAPGYRPGGRLVIEARREQHHAHVWAYRRQAAWEAFKQRVADGSFADEYVVIGMDLAKEPKPGSMTENDEPIGIVDGQVITVDKDAPPWKPKVVDEKGNPVELDEDDE